MSSDDFERTYKGGIDDFGISVVPDLSILTEKEFQQRLKNLRESHMSLMELCDQVGIRECSSDKIASKNTKIAKRNNLFLKSVSNESLNSVTNSRNIYKNFSNIGPNSIRPSNSDTLLNLKLTKYFDENESLSSYNSFKTRSLISDFGIHRKIENKKPVTICKPFSMTIREEEKKNNNFLTKSSKQLEKDLLMKKELEEVELRNKFEALPIPSNTYKNLFEEMQRSRQMRKELSLMIRSEHLKSTIRPFKFLERGGNKNLSESFHREIVKDDFKANPFPAHIFSEQIDEKRRKTSILRQIRSAERSEQLLKSSMSLSSMKHGRIKHKCHPPVPVEKKRDYILRSDALRLSGTFCNPSSSSSSSSSSKCTNKTSNVESCCGCSPSCPGDMLLKRNAKTNCRLHPGIEKQIDNIYKNHVPKKMKSVESLKSSKLQNEKENEIKRPTRRRDEYWIDEKTKKEIEAELENIVL